MSDQSAQPVDGPAVDSPRDQHESVAPIDVVPSAAPVAADQAHLLTHRRVTRAATIFAVGLAVLIVVGAKLSLQFEQVDLAKGKPWHASSALFPCYPERIDCGGAKTTIFFHTQEENEPWVVIDLQAPTQFKSVSVVNRRDGAKERAVPLALEVSDDENSWRELARRDDEFSVWKPSFAQTTARFVRLKALKKTFLHLDSVKVHP